MTAPFELRIYENRQLVQTAEFSGPVVIGRQRSIDELLFSRSREGDVERWVVARAYETEISRHQLRVEPLDNGRVRVVSRQTISFLEGNSLVGNEPVELPLPVGLVFGATKTLRIEDPSGFAVDA